MKTVNTHEAKTRLSALLEEVSQGKEIVIARANRPIARLVAAAREGTPRRPGLLKGKIEIAEDFDAPLPESILRGFEGKAGGKP